MRSSVAGSASSAPGTPWGRMLVAGLGAGVVWLGARGFLARGRFGPADVLSCVLLLVPAAVLLLVTSYVVQHARFAAVLPLLFAGMAARAYPAFAVALGVALMGAVAVPAFAEWSDARRRRDALPT